MPARRTGWKRPEAIRDLVERLEARYGRPRHIARFDPMEELVSCILSQHTTDANSFPAFTRLRERYPEWQDVVDAGPEGVADAIRNAGLANQKSRSILGCLARIREELGDYSLEPLRKMPTLEARAWLMRLPGVGPKTASIVLCFAMGRETVPVDTHVYRVSRRLGLFDGTVNENQAHDVLLGMVPADLAYRFHTALIQHGRVICRAPTPRCEVCPVADLCRWYRENVGKKAEAA